MDADLRCYCQKRKVAMLAERQPYEADWKTVADYVDPYAGRYLPQSGQDGLTPQKLPSRAKIINSASTMSLRGMDAGFMGGHSSKSRPWFRLGVSNPALAERTDARRWLDDATEALRDVLARSNFYTALPDFYHARHLFGTAAMTAEEDDKEVVRFYVRAIGSYAVALDRRGRCNALWYCYSQTANQIEDKFAPLIGRDKLPAQVLNALNTNRGDTKFKVESLVEPNPDGRAGLLVPEDRRPFRQVYWIDGTPNDTHGCLWVTGHYEMPEMVSRWSSTGADIYGGSPVLDAVGDIRQLQYLEGKKLKIIDHLADPALGIPDSAGNKNISIRPGERVYLTPMQTQQKIEPIYTPNANALTAVQAEIATVTQRIEKALFTDLFRMLDFLEDRERTAYEISERKEEKIAQLGPSLESLTDEVFDPCVERTFAIATRAGVIPPPPPSLDGVVLKIEYTSMLAQAQKALATGTVERVVAFLGNLAAAKQDPSVFDVVDEEETARLVHDQQGAPEKMLRSPDEVAEMRAQRARQTQMAQAAAMAPALKQGAEALHLAGQTKPEDGTLLDAAGQMGQSALGQ